MPRISDVVPRSVVFLYRSVKEAHEGVREGGTGFLVGVPTSNPALKYVYVVTASHVITGRRGTGAPVVRVNTKDGKFRVIEIDQGLWTHHPGGADLAVCLLDLEHNDDFMFHSVDDFATDEIIKAYNLGIGDDAFMSGRLVDVPEAKCNRPVLRSGNIAQMPDVDAPISSDVAAPQVSFLVEMRSRSGFSGSPVFVYIPASMYRMDSKGLRMAANEMYGPWLLGVDWGQIGNEEPHGEGWHAASMIGVVPAWYLADLLLKEPWLVEQRRVADERRDARSAARGESAEAPKADENPRHKEDFTSLLNAATRGNKPTGQT